MSDKSKYEVNDVVEFCNNRATIIRVNEHHYFYGGDAAYYTYVLQYDNGGFVAEVTEPALSLLSKGNGVIVKKNRFCECGAWATGSNADHHSRWCPAYRTFERIEE